MGFTIPFSKYRDAKVVLPKVFTPAEAETFKKAILPIIAESNDGNIVGDDYEEPCLIVHMFLSARNAKCIGTKRDIIHIPHSVKISEEKIAYISIPENMNRIEKENANKFIDQICEHYVTKA